MLSQLTLYASMGGICSTYNHSSINSIDILRGRYGRVTFLYQSDHFLTYVCTNIHTCTYRLYIRRLYLFGPRGADGSGKEAGR